MSAIDRLKDARSKEELAEALEPIVASLVIIAEETLPKVERLEKLLNGSGDALARLEALIASFVKKRADSAFMALCAACCFCFPFRAGGWRPGSFVRSPSVPPIFSFQGQSFSGPFTSQKRKVTS